MDDQQLDKIKRLFGGNVRHYRTVKSLTQMDLAVAIGSDLRQIQRIESGETATSIVNAYLIAKALEVSLDKLFEG